MTEEITNVGSEIETDVSIEGNAAESEAPESNEQEAADNGEPSNNVDKELKTVRKALDKRNRYINNQRQRIRDLENKMREMEQGFSQKKAQAPEMEQFDSVLDYMKADQNYTLEQKLSEQQHNQQLEMLRSQQDAVIAQQAQEMAVQMSEIMKHPDVKKTISENANVINQMPPHIERLMVEIDDAPAATYALAKEGRLQDLYYMPPHIAAAHLVQAEIRGQQYLQQESSFSQQPPAQQKQPPKPIGSLKGSGKSSTAIPSLKGEKLLNWIGN